MAQAARKVTAKDANEKLAHRRLTVLDELLWLQPARGAVDAGGPAGLRDHDPEDPQRQGPRHAPRALTGARAHHRRPSDRADPGAGRIPGEAQPMLQGA